MNIYPGMGLGFSASKEMAYGLAPIVLVAPPIPETEGGGYVNWRHVDYSNIRVRDNAYSYSSKDDDEIIELLSILFEVID